MNPENVVNITRDFLKKYEDEKAVQIIGGLASTATADPASRFSVDDATIGVPKDFYLPAIRGNGSRRDVDVFVNSTDDKFIEKVRQDLTEIVDGRLDVSVFGVIERELPHNLGFAALKTFLADRYNLPGSDEMVKALYPFSAPIDPSGLEPWRVEGDGFSFHMPHPSMSLLNYCNRSISGVRAKDADKVSALAARLQAESSKFYEWTTDGPGKSQLELARLIHSAGVGIEPLNHVLPESQNIKKMTKDETLENPYFMLRDDPSMIQKIALAQFAFKAKSLRFFESSATVRAVFQKYAERGLASSIVENS